MQVTVGTKYQIVIPKEVRSKLNSLSPGDKVNIQAIDKHTFSVKTDPLAWIKSTSGLMKEAWKDIDPIKELEKMRDEWDERLNELGKTTK